MSSEAVLPGVAEQGGHSRGGRHYFLGGQAGVSFAYVTEMRTDCDWLRRPLFILLLLRNTLGCSSCTPLPLPCFQEGLSEAWRSEGKFVLSPEEGPVLREERKAEYLQGRGSQLSYPSAKVPLSPWRLVGHCLSNQSLLYPDKC